MMKATRFAALILMASATASASPPPLNAPPSVTAYLDQVAATEKPGPKMSLEPVYNAALAAQNDLMIINNNQAWIEGLSDADFTTLQSRLKARGVCYMVLAENCDIERIRFMALQHRLSFHLIHTKKIRWEENYIFEIKCA